MSVVRASRYILVKRGSLRIVDYPRDGVYDVLEFDSEDQAYTFLQRFARNPTAMERLEELADEETDDDEDEEDEDEEDDPFAGRSKPLHAAPKKRDILAEIAEMIAEEEIGVAEEIHRTNPPTRLDEAPPAAAPAPPPEEKKSVKKLT